MSKCSTDLDGVCDFFGSFTNLIGVYVQTFGGSKLAQSVRVHLFFVCFASVSELSPNQLNKKTGFKVQTKQKRKRSWIWIHPGKPTKTKGETTTIWSDLDEACFTRTFSASSLENLTCFLISRQKQKRQPLGCFFRTRIDVENFIGYGRRD